MDETPGPDDAAPKEAPPEPPSEAPQNRPVPMAAIAGAMILVGLVAFALHRRGMTTAPAGAESPAPEPPAAAQPAPAPAPDGAPPAGEAPAAPAAQPDAAAPQGTAIAAQPPTRLSPEASVLAERYRCVCGCNLTLSVCTCRNDKGSEDMKKALNVLVAAHTSATEADRAMVAQFGPVALLSNPAPPSTLPMTPAAPAPQAGSKKTPAPTKKKPASRP